MSTPHQGQDSTENLFSRSPVLRALKSATDSAFRFGVTPEPSQSPIEIGCRPSAAGSLLLIRSKAQISDAARWNCWVVSSRNVYLIRTVAPAFS